MLPVNRPAYAAIRTFLLPGSVAVGIITSVPSRALGQQGLHVILKVIAVLALLIVALFFTPLALPVELMEPEGAAHAYPALLDLNGKKLANGEFMQWIQNERLHVTISYQFSDGQRFEERAVLKQKPELMQEEWSWKEIKNGNLSREFAVNFLSKTATARKHENSELKHWSDKIDVETGRTFAGFGFTLALQNLRKRLIDGDQVELKAVGFTPKPRVGYGPNFTRWSRSDPHVRPAPQRRSLHNPPGDSVDCQIIYSCAGHANLADESSTGWLPPMGRASRVTERSAYSCRSPPRRPKRTSRVD
jgi:hypothetical protein